MAKSLYLTYNSVTANLLTELVLAENGFQFATGDGLMWTTFETVNADADATFRTLMAKLDTFHDGAVRFDSDNNERLSCLLIMRSEGESHRQARVHQIVTETAGDGVLTPMLGRSAARVRVAIQHDAVWEDSGVTVISTTGVSTTGGVWVIGNDAGSMAQRIRELVATSTYAGYLSKFWIGIRNLREGYQGFIPLWEAESGTNILDASDVSDGTASGGYRVSIDFGTSAAMAKRFTIRWGQVAGSYAHHIIGRYLVLARCKLSSSITEVAVDLRHGWAGFAGMESSAGITYLSAVSNANLTNWNLIPLGTVQIPPTGNRDDLMSAEVEGCMLSVFAERMSAAGSLYVDCFILIPAEHLVVVSGASVGNAGGPLEIYTPTADEPYALGKTAAAGLYGNVEYSFENWNYPRGGGILVLAAQEATQHALSVTCNLDGEIMPRWRGYR